MTQGDNMTKYFLFFGLILTRTNNFLSSALLSLPRVRLQDSELDHISEELWKI